MCWSSFSKRGKELQHINLNVQQYIPHILIYVCVCVERERETCVLPKGFKPESFQLKYNPPTFEYKIHSVEVDLYYFKYL